MNDYRNNEWYSDRFDSNYTYMMLGNKIVYKTDLKSFKREIIRIRQTDLWHVIVTGWQQNRPFITGR